MFPASPRRIPKYPRRLAALSLLLSLSACGGSGPSGTWHGASQPASAECDESCVEVATLQGGHGGDLKVLADPRRDGPRRQWQLCFATFYACWDEGGAVASCVEAASCPTACKEQFVAQAAGATDLESELAAYRAVFVTEGAPCADPGPPEGLPL